MQVNDIVQVQIVTSTTTQLGLNTVHYLVTAVGGAGVDTTDVATFMDGIFAGPVKNLLSEEARYEGILATKIWPQPRSVRGKSTAGAGIGATVGDGLPWQVSGVITIATLLGGRKYRGRMFVPFASESDNDNNIRPVAGYVARLNALAALLVVTQNIVVGANSNTLVPVLYHRGDHSTTPIETATGRDLWGTQRRRGGFGQQNVLPLP
jgi:hypothetical protein